MPRLCEPFAGLGSFSLRCLWEAAGSDPRRRWEPPVSRQGSKSGFVLNEFRAFGLVRQKWDAVLLNDLCPVAHLFHLLYASVELRDLVARRLWAMVPCPECLHEMREAAIDGAVKPTPAMCLEWLKSGTGEVQDPDCTLCSGTGVMDARQLWEKIRKEPVPGDLVEACAAGLWLQGTQFSNAVVTSDGHNWGRIGGGFGFKDGTNGGMVNPREELASRVSSLPSGMASLADLTARALFMQQRTIFSMACTIEADGKFSQLGFKPERVDTIRESGGSVGNMVPRPELAMRVSLLPGPGGCHIGISRMDALEFVRGLVLGKEDVLIVDSPYAGTSGYAHDSPRGDVLQICEIGHKAGALVICHEGVGLAKELGSGWMERSASPLRSRGSTFHAGGVEREWITFNRPVQWWPSEQVGLFG